ncbi:MAG: hypothetical protein QOF02_1176 [Blastocatellia bacterium]|jgi:hypothetical protein|nr:hypothetical protein [Blastocatellia bacterium]
MKEVSRSEHGGLRLLLAFIALSMLFVHNAAAQVKQDFAHDTGLAAARCLDNQLSLSHDGEDAAMGGLRSMQFFFTNISSTPCALKGYPRFELLNKSGGLVRGGRAANGLTRMGDEFKEAPQLVTIEPGNKATFWIDYHARGAGSMGKPCPTYRRFRITAPGTKRVFVQRDAIEVCSGLEVSPVRSPSGEQR